MDRLKFKTSSDLPITLEEFMGYTSNSYRKTEGCQHVTSWTCKHLDLNRRLCPKSTPVTEDNIPNKASPHTHRLGNHRDSTTRWGARENRMCIYMCVVGAKVPCVRFRRRFKKGDWHTVSHGWCDVRWRAICLCDFISWWAPGTPAHTLPSFHVVVVVEDQAFGGQTWPCCLQHIS